MVDTFGPAPRTTRGLQERGAYGQVVGRAALNVLAWISPALPDEESDFDRAGRGHSIRHGLYAWDPKARLAVVQVRQTVQHSRNSWRETRKSYFLCGQTEAGSAFRHPVSAHVVRAAIRKDPNDHPAIVQAAQRWIFGCTPKQWARGVRQGDVLMIPSRQPHAGCEHRGTRLTVDGSAHDVRASAIVTDPETDAIYAYDPALYHVKGQHAPVYASTVDSWWEIRLGREGPTYAFAGRLGD